MAGRAEIARALVRSAQKRRRKPLPRQQPPRLIEASYARALLALVVPRLQTALGPALRELPGLMARAAARADARHDSDETRSVRVLLDLSKDKLTDALNSAEIRNAAAKHAADVGQYNRVQLGRQIEAGVGSNILGIDSRAKRLINAFPEGTGAALRNMGERTVGDIQSLVVHAMGAGKLYPSIQSKVERRLEVAASRVRAVANNEVGSLYAAVNVARQRELGLTRFVWRSMGDDRVRDEHELRDGQEYEFSDPPDGELPGEPFMCRCWAEPVLEDIAEDEPAASEETDEPYAEFRVSLEPDDDETDEGFGVTSLPVESPLVPEIPELEQVLADLTQEAWGSAGDAVDWGGALSPDEAQLIADRAAARRRR